MSSKPNKKSLTSGDLKNPTVIAEVFIASIAVTFPTADVEKSLTAICMSKYFRTPAQMSVYSDVKILEDSALPKIMADFKEKMGRIDAKLMMPLIEALRAVQENPVHVDQEEILFV
jgi:hypothetical protein